MDTSLPLPDRESYVSSAQVDGSRLSVRLLSDYHPGSEQSVYLLVAEEPAHVTEAIQFLERCRADDTYVYVSQKGGAVSFETESGEELVLHARTFSSTPTTFNEQELNEALKRVWGWYLSENEACRAASARFHAARELLNDAAQRIEVKAAGHPSGTAAVLYSQQLTLIKRVLNALGT